MNITEIKQKIENGAFDKDFSMLYGDVSAARARYTAACDSFCDIFSERDNIRLFSAPGRTEVGGNHTDHQHGCVLAGGVNLDVIAVVAPNNDGKVRIKSEGYDMDTVDICKLERDESEHGRASALIRGVLSRFKELGCTLSGFNAYTTSNVLKGSGLSSSAAFEVLVGNIVNGMFFGTKADEITVAKIGQYAEREYFGKPCGLLDQMASSLGGFTYADFFDPAEPITEKINLDIHSFGYTLCVVDTGSGKVLTITPPRKIDEYAPHFSADFLPLLQQHGLPREFWSANDRTTAFITPIAKQLGIPVNVQADMTPMDELLDELYDHLNDASFEGADEMGNAPDDAEVLRLLAAHIADAPEALRAIPDYMLTEIRAAIAALPNSRDALCALDEEIKRRRLPPHQ